MRPEFFIEFEVVSLLEKIDILVGEKTYAVDYLPNSFLQLV